MPKTLRACGTRSFLRQRALLGSVILTTALSAWPVLAQENRTVVVDLPAQSLGAALSRLAEQADLEMILPTEMVSGRTSPAVVGNMTVGQAMSRVLAGSGLNYSVTGANTVVITKPGGDAGAVATDGSILLNTITIAGSNPNSTMALPGEYAGGQVARGGQLGMLGNRDVMNTPFSQTSYTRNTIENQQARNIHEVLSNDPSVTGTVQGPGSGNERLRFRGFLETQIEGSNSLNGLMGIAPISSAAMDYVERVEVLRGPGALLNGTSSSGGGAPGGSFNLVTKTARDVPLTQLTTGYETESRAGVHLDFGRRFGDQKQFGIRFNGALRKGDLPVKPQSSENGSVALNMDYRGERLRLSADIAHQWHDGETNRQQVQIYSLGFVPKAPDGGTSLTIPWSENESTATIGMVRGEYDIADNVTAYGAIGWQRNESESFRPYGTLVLRSRDGEASYETSASYEIYRREVLSLNAGLRATVNTGAVDHALSFNAAQSRMKYSRASSDETPSYNCSTNIYDPVFSCSVPIRPDLGPIEKASESKVTSIGIADVMSLYDDRVQIMAGLRYQKLETDEFNNSSWDKDASYGDSAWSPSLGLVWKPRENVSFYANYIENLQAGTVVGEGYTNVGEIFPPYDSKQYEAGVKVDWGSVTTTLAAFQITQPNTLYETDDAGRRWMSRNGEQRNRGVELNAFGELRPDLRLMGGFTFLNARLKKTTGGEEDGLRATDAPVFRAVIGGEWDTPFLDGLTLTGRVTHSNDWIALRGDTGDVKAPGYTTLDLGARYTFDPDWSKNPVTVRLNVDNALDKDYWLSGDTVLFLGAPRTVRLSLTTAF